MDWEALSNFGKVFGLPGLLLLFWYLLERDKGKRADAIKQQEIAVRREETQAMTAGFTSLAGKMDAHHSADIQSHQEMATSIARLEGKLDTIHEFTPVNAPIPRKATPAHGMPAGYYPPQRPKTQGGGR